MIPWTIPTVLNHVLQAMNCYESFFFKSSTFIVTLSVIVPSLLSAIKIMSCQPLQIIINVSRLIEHDIQRLDMAATFIQTLYSAIMVYYIALHECSQCIMLS